MTTTLEGADLFCGTGIISHALQAAMREKGLDIHVVAVNHWDVAIATYKANIPNSDPRCQKLENTKPIELVPSGHLDLLWASPECTYHSRARGSKPMSDQLRVSPWLINRWFTDLDVERLIIENVPEFTNWGPMLYTKDCVTTPNHEHHCQRHNQTLSKCQKADAKQPDPTRKGTFFQSWRQSLIECGYEVDWKLLNCADYGDATTRTRFFLIARKDGKPLQWPEATHAPKHQHGATLLDDRKPWRGAIEILDLADTGPSMFSRKKKLSENTQIRIARGSDLYWGDLAPWYINMLNIPKDAKAKFVKRTSDYSQNTSDKRPPFVLLERTNNVPKSIHQPFGTITTIPGMRLIQASLEPVIFANRSNNAPRDLSQPIPPATTAHSGGTALITPKALALSQASAGAARPASQPLPTIVSKGAVSTATPALIQYNGNSAAQSIDDPLNTTTGKDHFGLASPIILTLRGTAGDQLASTTKSTTHPLSAISGGGMHHYVATPLITAVDNRGQAGKGVRSAEQPITTVTGKQGHAIATPLLNSYGPRAEAQPATEPLPVVMTEARLAVATPFIVPRLREKKGQLPRVHGTDQPIPTVTTENRHNLVSPLIITIGNTSRTDDGVNRPANAPIATCTERNNYAVATPEIMEWIEELDVDPRRIGWFSYDGGETWEGPYVGDIHYRMLKPVRELARAHSFPPDYKFSGKQRDITKQIGNSVPLETAKALVLAMAT